MKLTNNEIYFYANELLTYFGQDCEIKFPIKVNFFLQRNIKKMTELAQDIETSRIAIAKEYGEPNEEGSYAIAPDKIEEASKELNDLFSLEQDVDIHIFKIDDFTNIELSMKQMNALMFMIEE